MKCRINKGENGEIISVITESGEESQVFKQLKPKIGEELALDVTALTETEDFKNLQAFKKSNIIAGNKTILQNNVRNFAKDIGASLTQRLDSFRVENENSELFFKPNYITNNIELELVSTKPESRGLGFAKQLTQKFVKDAGAAGFNVELIVSPRDNSTTEKGLKKFYRGLGFANNGTNFEMIRRPLRSDKEDNTTVQEITRALPIPTQPTVEEAVVFATNTGNIISDDKKLQINNTVLGLGLSSYGELLDKMENLLQDGIMLFTENNLNRTGLYNNYEINSILNNISLQENIRDTYQALKNSDDTFFDSINPAYIIKTSEINTIGKQNILNPYQVEQEVKEIIAGKDLSVSLDDIPYDSIKNFYRNNEEFRAELDNVAANNRNIQVKKIELNELLDKTVNTNRELFEKTLDLDSREVLNPVIDLLSGISNTVWNDSYESIYTILKDFNKKAIKSGIDFLDLEEKTLIKTQPEILELLESFSDVLNRPTENNLDYFFDMYSEFFDIPNEPLIETASTRDDTNIYLETDISEVSLFTEFGLLKESENVYKQIEVIQDTEQAYSILLANNDKIPVGITTIEQLKEYVNSIMNNYNSDSFEINLSDLENVIIHKLYFEVPISYQTIKDNQAEEKASNFTGDFNYLTKQFVSDFYQRYIREKKSNSQLYKNFYKNFTINEKGIVLLDSDPLTISQIEPYIDENLSMYNLISKNLNLPLNDLEIIIDRDEMQFRREYAISNPSSVEKIKGEYMTVSPETIAVRNETNTFVKTPSGIYEYDYQMGDVAFYNKLPEGSQYYNSYGQHRVKSDSSVDVRDYGNLEIIPENFVRARNFYSKKELEEINKNNFNC